jgi:hypothetical protein
LRSLILAMLGWQMNPKTKVPNNNNNNNNNMRILLVCLQMWRAFHPNHRS